jgi:hypothetical protein
MIAGKEKHLFWIWDLQANNKQTTKIPWLPRSTFDPGRDNSWREILCWLKYPKEIQILAVEMTADCDRPGEFKEHRLSHEDLAAALQSQIIRGSAILPRPASPVNCFTICFAGIWLHCTSNCLWDHWEFGKAKPLRTGSGTMTWNGQDFS